MEKTNHAALAGEGGVTVQASKERIKLSSSAPPPPTPGLATQPTGAGFWLAPGPRLLCPPPGPCGFETPLRSLANRGRPGTRAPRRAHSHPPGIETGPSGGLAPWRLAAVRSGEGGDAAATLRGRPAGSLARPRGPRREGPAPRLPSRSRTSRAAAEGALPAPARSRASSIARRPPRPEESLRGDGERLRAASRGFKDNNKKMATTQLPLRTPSENATAPGGGG